MGSIVLLDDLKAKLHISSGDSGQDAELSQAIAQAEGEFESGIGQKLLAADYVETREGNGLTYLQLRWYPFLELQGLALENESDPDIEDLNVVRVAQGTDGLPWLTLVDGRRFTPPRWHR